MVMNWLLGLLMALSQPLEVNKVVQEASVHIIVSKIPSTKGAMRIALFDKAEGFREEDYAVRKELFPVKALKDTYVFEGLKPGKYGIAIYHDANNNGKLDTNFMGIPTEAYGFSNNVMGWFGPPDFKDTLVDLKPGSNTVQIELR